MLFDWIAEWFRPHYILHVRLDDMHCNVFINSSPGTWALQHKAKGGRAVLMGAWKCSIRVWLEHERLKTKQ